MKADLKTLLARIFLCTIGDHDWTSAPLEGQKPTSQQLATGLAGFRDHCRMWCKRCGAESKYNDW